MTTRLVVAALVVAVVAGLAYVLTRRRPEGPTQPRAAVPRQLDRADFPRPDATWLVVLFSSSDCDGCAAIAEAIAGAATDRVAVHESEYHADGALHARYHVEQVPLVVIADREGVVRESFVGRASGDAVRAALERVASGRDA